MKLRNLIGTRTYYKKVLAIAVPIMIQNGITNFVSLLDNIMVGRVGTEQMSGVAIMNQLFFVYSLFIFGGISGAGIFGSQFFGQGNHKGVRDTFRFKLIICAALTAICTAVFLVFGEQLISLYLHGDNSSLNAERVLIYSKRYLRVIILEMIPFAMVQAYAGTLRETGETLLPMKAGIVAVFINLIFNYILIFGKLGAPELGIEGAAIATVLARIVECLIIVIWTHRHTERNLFIIGVYRHFRIPIDLIKKITIKGLPLLVNEGLWASGIAITTQCYSMRGIEVVAAQNISSTISNLFNIVFIALGSAVAIIVGQQLGAKEFERAKTSAFQLINFSVLCTIVIGAIMALLSPLFPQIYNTTNEVRSLAKNFIIVVACVMPIQAFINATYFTLRSGGKTLITFLFDSVFVWVVSIPLAYLLARYSGLSIVGVYLTCELADIIKLIIGTILLQKGVWIQNIVES